MSNMSELAIEIEELYEHGYRPTTIAARLNVPLEMVYQWLEQTGEIAYDPFETINS